MTKLMKALVLRNGNNPSFGIEPVEIPGLQDNDVLVRMKTAALNHRDEWIRQGRYAKIMYPALLGSDGCGIVEQVRNADDNHWLGKRVIINPSIGWGSDPKAQAPDYQILGMPTNGTFAEYLVVNSKQLHEPPGHLSDEEAAALPLAGLTAYRALRTRANVQSHHTVLVTGIGGGVALFDLLFAVKIGARVYVTSGSDEKIERAKKFGAIAGVNYKMPQWSKELQAMSGGFDIILDSAGGSQMNDLIDLARPGATIVFYGATLGDVDRLNLRKIFWKQLQLQGSTMGTNAEFAAMLEFVAKHKIVPVIDSVRPFTGIVSAFEDMRVAKQFGKLVVRIPE